MHISSLLYLALPLVNAGALPNADDLSVNYLDRRAFAPISTNSPNGIAGGNVACDAPPVNSFMRDLKPPFPTNGWWAPYAAPPGNATAAGPFPFQSNMDGKGIAFGISTNREFDGTSVKQPTQTDWLVGFTEHNGDFANHKATSFDTQAVTAQYFQGGSTLTTPLVPGSPYMSFNYKDATPIFTSLNGDVKTINGKDVSGGSVDVTGTTFTVVSSRGSTYIIYALSSITLTASQKDIRAKGKFNGVVRFAMLSKPEHKQLLDQHYQIYPTGVNTDYSFTDAAATLSFTWSTTGNGDLLMLSWPHHRLVLQNANQPAPSTLGYLTTKGWMHPVIGNNWRMTHQLGAITWNPPRKLDTSCSDSVIAGLEYEIKQLNASSAPVPGDFYYWGGTLAAQSRLALIADHVGRQDLIQPVVTYLKASFQHWFDGTSKVKAAYETGWGGVINKDGANNAYVDFGNGYYNDHHFHYGYFLNVAAVIAKYDNGWLNQHRDTINLFARDIINPSAQDPYFPIARCRDWFAGHSWASGIANGAGSRDQESSGEGINGYYGALLWASVALSPDHVNYAKLLLATEQQAAQVYWHLYPQKSETDINNPYPEKGMRDRVSMGNVEDWQSGAWLFWGDQKVEIAAIQILPITPANEVLYDDQWVQNVWSYTSNEMNDPKIGDEWKCVIIAAYANSNPQVAAEWSSKLTTWGSGNTFTNELFFIGTRPNKSGQPICGKLPQNPYGDYKIQVASSGKYVASSSSNSKLIASAGSGDAAVFKSAYVPNAGTLQLKSTSQYVTSDQSGKNALDAARGTASSWERFTIRQKTGAANGVYSIKASSNGLYVTVSGDGSLINSEANEANSAGFKFVS